VVLWSVLLTQHQISNLTNNTVNAYASRPAATRLATDVTSIINFANKMI